VVVLCGGTLDVTRNDASKGLSAILQLIKNSEHTNVIIIDVLHRFDLEASTCVNKEVNAFNRKLNKIIKPYEHNSQLHLNMQRVHCTKHGMHINGSGKDRISGLLTLRIMELLTTHRLGTSITLPWKTETTEKKEKKMKSFVEKSNFTGPELIVTDEQGKPTSVKEGSVKVQNVGFVPANNVEHGALGEMRNSSNNLCNYSDSSTQPLQITQNHKQTNKHKRTTKIPKQDLMIFMDIT